MKSKIIFDLSKEYSQLAQDEILSCLTSEGTDFSIVIKNENVLVIQSTISSSMISLLSQRLAMSFNIGRFLFHCDPSIKQLKHLAIQNPISSLGSIAVKYKNRSQIVQSKPLLSALADVYTKNRTVNLDHPDNIIYLLISDNSVYVSELLQMINRGNFEQRKAHFRPFFSPISLHPKIARALVNLTEVKAGNLLLDPFCGTGGLLIEAGLMGIKIFGSDISADMIKGCKKNLNYYHLEAVDLIQSDVTHLPNVLQPEFDGIVTDLPYGKATSTQGEPLETLYENAIDSIQMLLKPGKRAVIGSFSDQLKHAQNQYLIHCVAYPLRVHQSLTRWFHVFKKRP